MGVQAHKDASGRYGNAKVGHFFPLHPEKYIGDATRIVFKSSLEQRFMLYLDKNPAIRYWKYEPQAIKYFDASSNKYRKYYIDFVVCVKGNANQSDKILWCEVKSKKETLPPKRKNDVKANLIYLKNISKWKYAAQYCLQHSYEFKIITEDQLK